MLTKTASRGGSRAAASSKMECFAIIVYDFQPLTIITKHSILDIAAALDPPLVSTILKKRQSCHILFNAIMVYTKRHNIAQITSAYKTYITSFLATKIK